MLPELFFVLFIKNKIKEISRITIPATAIILRGEGLMMFLWLAGVRLTLAGGGGTSKVEIFGGVGAEETGGAGGGVWDGPGSGNWLSIKNYRCTIISITRMIRIKNPIFLASALLCLILAAFTGYTLSFRGLILRNIYISDIDVSGLTTQLAEKK